MILYISKQFTDLSIVEVTSITPLNDFNELFSSFRVKKFYPFLFFHQSPRLGDEFNSDYPEVKKEGLDFI